MSWSIQQVARVSGMTARPLRYYDEIELLRPARVGANGYRYYEREQLLRLQQILLLRELGLDLTTIGGVVDAQHDPIEALRRHHRRLLDERGRLDRLAVTVAATIKHLEEGTGMPAENLFEGFELSPEYLAELEARRVEITGNEEQPELAEIKRNTAEWSEQDFGAFNAEGADLTRRMLTLLRDGVVPDDAATFAVLDNERHRGRDRRLRACHDPCYQRSAPGTQGDRRIHDPRVVTRTSHRRTALASSPHGRPRSGNDTRVDLVLLRRYNKSLSKWRNDGYRHLGSHVPTCRKLLQHLSAQPTQSLLRILDLHSQLLRARDSRPRAIGLKHGL
jgi:MerR family transcriptional regulator, thiopeptide resistance regulator